MSKIYEKHIYIKTYLGSRGVSQAPVATATATVAAVAAAAVAAVVCRHCGGLGCQLVWLMLLLFVIVVADWVAG